MKRDVHRIVMEGHRQAIGKNHRGCPSTSTAIRMTTGRELAHDLEANITDAHETLKLPESTKKKLSEALTGKRIPEQVGALKNKNGALRATTAELEAIGADRAHHTVVIRVAKPDLNQTTANFGGQPHDRNLPANNLWPFPPGRRAFPDGSDTARSSLGKIHPAQIAQAAESVRAGDDGFVNAEKAKKRGLNGNRRRG